MKDIRQAVLKASAALKVLSEVVSELGAFAADALDVADAFESGDIVPPHTEDITVPDNVPVVPSPNETAISQPAASSAPSLVQCQAPQCGTILLPDGLCPRCGWRKGQ